MASERTRARIAARIKERTAHCIEFELADPRAHFITVTNVEVAADLSAAKVFYSVLGSPSEQSQVRHMFEKAAGFVQRQVARVLQTRVTPRLSFIYDDSLERAAELDAVIQAALNRDASIRGEEVDEPEPAEATDTDEPEEVDPDGASTDDVDEAPDEIPDDSDEPRS
ncbi:MAG: 30S ribosome-binding factor RbfA [Planctomycetota bacterium]|nr:30S ribosome-binding factor RbfA [Planctomycetota bacterium]